MGGIEVDHRHAGGVASTLPHRLALGAGQGDSSRFSLAVEIDRQMCAIVIQPSVIQQFAQPADWLGVGRLL